jgi:hypothetical protein
MHGLIKGAPARRQRQSVPRHKRIKHGEVVAARRALTAAAIYGTAIGPTLVKAARGCGTTVPYVRAALILRNSGDGSLVADVLEGQTSLLVAAARVEAVVKLAKAYRATSTTDRIAWARGEGIDPLFEMLVSADA